MGPTVALVGTKNIVLRGIRSPYRPRGESRTLQLYFNSSYFYIFVHVQISAQSRFV